MLNRSDIHYIERMYGKKSKEYSIAEQLNIINERLNETNTVSLIKDCKMETISYIATIVDKNDESYFILKKLHKNKNSGKVKEKVTEEKNAKKYQVLDHFINFTAYDLLLKGYKLV